MRLVQIYTSLMIGFNSASPSLSFIIQSDFFKLFNTAALGYGNGFLGTLLMVLGPHKV
jgi:hypothetical protein